MTLRERVCRNAKKLPPWLSLLVAIVGVALSQFSPISTWFAASDLHLQESSELHVTHVLGTLVLTSFLKIDNRGGREGTVSEIRVVLTRQGTQSDDRHLVGDFYYETWRPQVSGKWPFANVKVDARSGWSAYIQFGEEMSNADLSTVNSLRTLLQNEVQSRSAQDRIAEISDELLSDMEAAVSRRLGLFEAGDYHMWVRIVGKRVGSSGERCYFFNLDERQMSVFRKVPKRYAVEGRIVTTLPDKFHVSVADGFRVKLTAIDCTDGG